jgi:hypothetical protein
VLGDIVGSGTPVNPLVGPLANNGGPTFTCALLAGSPALDSGDDSLLDPPLNLGTDQRGFARQSGSHVDIGVLEVQWAAPPLRVISCTRISSGIVQLTVTNIPGAGLTVLAASNATLPPACWSVLGSMAETSPGRFQITDPASTNMPRRFYQVRCP